MTMKPKPKSKMERDLEYMEQQKQNYLERLNSVKMQQPATDQDTYDPVMSLLYEWFWEVEQPDVDNEDGVSGDDVNNEVPASFVAGVILDTWRPGMTYREWADAARFKLGLFLSEEEMKQHL
jgi:hypothetical protein